MALRSSTSLPMTSLFHCGSYSWRELSGFYLPHFHTELAQPCGHVVTSTHVGTVALSIKYYNNYNNIIT